MLRDPGDAALKKRVKSLLLKMKDDPAYAIARVIEQPELSKMGGFPGASFLVEMQLGAEAGEALSGPLEQPCAGHRNAWISSRPPGNARVFFYHGEKYCCRPRSRRGRHAPDCSHRRWHSWRHPAHRQSHAASSHPLKHT